MPLYRKTKFDNGMVLTIWKIEELESDLRPLLSLNARDEKELHAVKASSSRLRWMASRLALKSVFDEWKVIEINKDVHGKPFFESEEGFFSLSHSGEFAVCAYHPEKKVGVDIEFVRDKILAIQKRFMKAEELDTFADKEKVERLLACWCAKEAIYKWQGTKGLSMREGITIHPFEYDEKGQITANLITEKGTEQLNVVYERLDGYMMAYVDVSDNAKEDSGKNDNSKKLNVKEANSKKLNVKEGDDTEGNAKGNKR